MAFSRSDQKLIDRLHCGSFFLGFGLFDNHVNGLDGGLNGGDGRSGHIANIELN
jgi:hypothetical protein